MVFYNIFDKWLLLCSFCCPNVFLCSLAFLCEVLFRFVRKDWSCTCKAKTLCVPCSNWLIRISGLTVAFFTITRELSLCYTRLCASILKSRQNERSLWVPRALGTKTYPPADVAVIARELGVHELASNIVVASASADCVQQGLQACFSGQYTSMISWKG